MCGMRHAGSIPASRGSRDVYVMRTILHDWSDERATDILRNTRVAIGALSFPSEVRVAATLQRPAVLLHSICSNCRAITDAAAAIQMH